MLYQLQPLFTVKLHKRIITSGKLERIGEEAVKACFKVLSWNSPGGTEGNHAECQSKQTVSQSGSE